MLKIGKGFAVMGMIAVLAGAGAAVGPILAQKLPGRTAVTATQALKLALPLVDMAYTPVPTIIGGATGTTYVTAQQLPQGARIYESIDETSTQFTVAADLTATSSKFDVIVPIANLSNNQIIAQLQLEVPEGVDVDVERSGPVDVTSFIPPDVSVAGKVGITRINATTWEGTWPPFTPSSEVAIDSSLVNIVGYNGFVLHIALHNGTPPGFYVIQGKVIPRNV